MKRILSVLSILCLVTGTVHAKYPTPDFGTIYIPWKGVSGVFTPASISGLTLWLKADAITGLVNNDPVATWTGSAGGNNATQATGANQPLYKTNILNGLPGLLFDGSNDGMATTVSYSSPYTFFIVAKAVGSSSRYLSSTTANRVLAFSRGGNAVYVGADVTSTTNLVPGTAAAYGVLTIGSTSNFRVSGVDRTDNAGLGGAGWGGMVLGYGGPFAEPASAYFFEILCYTQALSSTDRASVELYLKNKYAL